jgi:hypothetical protein
VKGEEGFSHHLKCVSAKAGIRTKTGWLGIMIMSECRDMFSPQTFVLVN